MKWYYWQNDAEVGPFDEETLMKLSGAGVINGETPVRTADATEWISFSDVVADKAEATFMENCASPAPEIYLSIDGQQSGPHSETEIRQLIDSGAVLHTQLAWRNGLSDWVPLAGILNLSIDDAPASAAGETHGFTDNLINLGRAAANEVKRGSHLAALKTTIEKLKMVDLAAARTDLGSRSFELRIPETFRSRHDEIAALKREIDLNRQGVTVGQGAHFKERVMATAKNTAGKAAAEAKELKLKHLYCALGEEVKKSPLVPELQHEADLVSKVQERIRGLASEYESHSTNHEARDSFKVSMRGSITKVGSLFSSGSKLKKHFPWFALVACVLALVWLVKTLQIPVWAWGGASILFLAGVYYVQQRIAARQAEGKSFTTPHFLKKPLVIAQLISLLVVLWLISSVFLSAFYKPAWLRSFPFQWCLDASIAENMELDRATSSIQFDIPNSATSIQSDNINEGIALMRSKERFWIRHRQKLEHTNSASDLASNIEFMTKGLGLIEGELENWGERVVKRIQNAGQDPEPSLTMITRFEQQIQRSVSANEIQRFETASQAAMEKYSDDARVRSASMKYLDFMKGIEQKAGIAVRLRASLTQNSSVTPMDTAPTGVTAMDKPPAANETSQVQTSTRKLKRTVGRDDYAKIKSTVTHRLHDNTIVIVDANGEVLSIWIKLHQRLPADAGMYFSNYGVAKPLTPEESIPVSYELKVGIGKDKDGAAVVEKDPTFMAGSFLEPIKKLVEWSVAANENQVADVERSMELGNQPFFTFQASEKKDRYVLTAREEVAEYAGMFRTYDVTDYYHAHLWEYLFENIEKIKAIGEQYFQAEKKRAETYAADSEQKEKEKIKKEDEKYEAEQKRLDNIFPQPSPIPKN